MPNYTTRGAAPNPDKSNVIYVVCSTYVIFHYLTNLMADRNPRWHFKAVYRADGLRALDRTARIWLYDVSTWDKRLREDVASVRLHERGYKHVSVYDELIEPFDIHTHNHFTHFPTNTSTTL